MVIPELSNSSRFWNRVPHSANAGLSMAAGSIVIRVSKAPHDRVAACVSGMLAEFKLRPACPEFNPSCLKRQRQRRARCVFPNSGAFVLPREGHGHRGGRLPKGGADPGAPALPRCASRAAAPRAAAGLVPCGCSLCLGLTC
jgi:hypothetical protein